MIRALRAGDTAPAGEPRRYMASTGYVRLRWRVGTDDYVEVLEHRFVMGIPEGEVHHRDGDKTNNHPSNLEVTSKRSHARYHGKKTAGIAATRRGAEWGGYRSQSAFEKSQRRLAREQARREEIARIVELRSQGLTTVEIGRRLGRDASNITRALQTAHAKELLT